MGGGVRRWRVAWLCATTAFAVALTTASVAAAFVTRDARPAGGASRAVPARPSVGSVDLSGLSIRVTFSASPGQPGPATPCDDPWFVVMASRHPSAPPSGNLAIETVTASAGGWRADAASPVAQAWARIRGSDVIDLSSFFEITNATTGERLRFDFQVSTFGCHAAAMSPGTTYSANVGIGTLESRQIGNYRTCGSGTYSRPAADTFAVQVNLTCKFPQQFHTADGCPAYYVLDTRPSGAPPGTFSAAGEQLAQALERLVAPAPVGIVANQYVAGEWSSYLTALRRKDSPYRMYVNYGTQWLFQKTSGLSRECKSTKVILTGYGQGAEATANAVRDLTSRFPNIVGVVLFGDPKFNGKDRLVDRGTYRRTRSGVLGARPLFQAQPGVRVLSYCHRLDPVCQRGAAPLKRMGAHLNYDRLGEPAAAAQALLAS